MKKIFSIISAATMVLAALAPVFAVPTAYAVGSNGSFEIGTDPGSYATLSAGDSTSITDWTVASGSVDYIGTYWPASQGTRSVDLNGNEQGSISQVLTTVAGDTYNITFDLSGNPDGAPSLKDVQVSASGAAPQDYTYDTSLKGNSLSDMKWQTNNSYSFVATTTATTLTFASQIAGAFGPVIDNVAITETAPAPTIPVYTGGSSCSQGKTPVLLNDLTQVISSQNPAPVTVNLPAAGEYLFEASGDYGYGGAPANNAVNRADAGYATGDNWTTELDSVMGIAPTATYRGVTSLLSDMGTGQMGIVGWGNYNSSHDYKFNYTTTGTNVQFVISDWWSNWYNGGVNNNQGGMGDNSGNLTLNVYQCQTLPSVITDPATLITTTGATVNGINGPFAADNTFFWLGTTNGGPFTAATDPTGQLPSGWSGVATGPQAANAAFSYAYTGLTPNTTYYFAAWSLVGGVWYPGAVLSFTTGAPAPTTGTISGMKYNDLNRNGQKDANEPGLANWTIRLKNENDVIVATTVTDADGNYSFANVAPGTYKVREVHKKGWKRISKNPKKIVIIAGSVVTDVNFGNATIRRGEKEDTDKDDQRNDQPGYYYANHGKSNYGKDQGNKDHQQPDTTNFSHSYNYNYDGRNNGFNFGGLKNK